jgi:dihydrofolate synthase/folylpolyglutamate synthase
MYADWGLADWLAFQETAHAAAIDLGLARVGLVAERLALNGSSLLTITVAGTNGKGSSTAMLSHIYAAAGYKVGWYSSPHLLHYNERIRINNEPVSDALLVDAFQAIFVVSQDLTLSYFEWGTLAALWLFKQQGCDVQVLEVGLGGRLDAVNVIDADAALITPIDIDHQSYLGDTREVIAVEKAGIFRAGQIAVCSDAHPPQSLMAAAEALALPLYLSGQAYRWQIEKSGDWIWQSNQEVHHLPAPALHGAFQYANAAGVLMLVYALQEKLPVAYCALAQGLKQVHLLGRLERRQAVGKTWLLDVAHNPQSVAALADYVASSSEPVIAVFSALSDKDIGQMLALISPYIHAWYIAPLDHSRAASEAQLRAAFASLDTEQHWFLSMADALAAAQSVPKSGIRLVFGSFLTVEQGLLWINAQQ